MTYELAQLLAKGLFGSSWLFVTAFAIIVTQLTIFSVTLYLHRGQAHRGVDFHPVLAHLFRFWTWLTTAMVTKEWVAIHRKHHAKCETVDDPHSPQIHGIRKVLFHGVVLYQEAKKDKAMVQQYGIGAPDDWLERRLYTPYSWFGPVVMLAINLVLLGSLGIAMWAIQMLWIPIFAAGMVNGLGHWWGYRNFETADSSTNLTPIALFIGGEELHNNHHAFPSSAKFALRSFEFDIGWSVLVVLRTLGLAKILRVAPTLEIRNDVEAPDGETLRAVLAHRFSVMKNYFRNVILPVIHQETKDKKDHPKLGARWRKALAADGHWLDEKTKARVSNWVSQYDLVAKVVDYRKRLAEILQRSGHSSEAMLEGLKHWCADAEQSGIAALQDFAKALRGYRLQVSAAAPKA